MTKEILKLTATFLGLEEVSNYLSSEEETEPSEEVKNQINQLIIFMNYVIREIAKDYFPLNFKETISSDQEGKIFYNKLKKTAIRIKDIKNFLDLSCHFEIVPKNINNITEEVELPFGVDYFIVCFGVASEYLSSKGLYEEAEMWESKFLSELKSIKHIHGERRFFARRLK